MGVSEIDDRTPDQIVADLKARQKDHKFLTTDAAQSWNAERRKKPLSKSHWSVKAGKITHVLRMGGAWKQLAKALYTDMLTTRVQLGEVSTVLRDLKMENARLRRMMEYCDMCSAAPGEDCQFNCSRDGLRDQ